MQRAGFVAFCFLAMPAFCRGGGIDFKRGQDALAKRDYDRAIACFTKAIIANPKDARAFSYRGLAHAKNCAFKEALGDCDQAIRLAPKEARPTFSAAAFTT